MKLDSKAKEIYRVVVSGEANKALDTVIAKVNAEWEAGKISKPQMVSWIIQRFSAKVSDKDIQEIRAAHFDKVAYLEGLLKKAKESGQVPTELDALFQGNVTASKKVDRLTRNITNGDVMPKDSIGE